jgi:16S rRNA processing protein RimM
MSGRSDWVEVGRVERALGLEGRMIVRLHGEDPENLLGAREVALDGFPGRIPFRILSAQPRPGLADGRARVELELSGLHSREEAAGWAGAGVSIRSSALRPLAAGEYYWRDLIGLTVRGADGRNLGTVQEIWPTGGHDLLVVATAGEPLLVPAIEPVLMRVDLDAGEIWVDPPPGLIPEEP